MLDRAADAAGDVELGRDLGCRSGRPARGAAASPAWSRPARRRARRRAARLSSIRSPKPFGTAGSATGADHDPRRLERAGRSGSGSETDTTRATRSASATGGLLDPEVAGPGRRRRRGRRRRGRRRSGSPGGRSSSMSSSAAPPTTCRVTVERRADPSTATTFAAIATSPSGREVGHHLVAARDAGGQHDDRTGAPRARRLDAGGPGGAGVGVEAAPVRACTSRDAVRRQLLPRPQVLGSPTTTASIAASPLAARRGSRAKVSASQRDLDQRAVAVGLDQDEDHRPSTPSFSKQVDDGGGGVRARSPRICTCDGGGSGSRSRTRDGPMSSVPGLALLDGDLLGLHPARDRRVARLDAALQDGDDGRQRHVVGLRVRRVRRRPRRPGRP